MAPATARVGVTPSGKRRSRPLRSTTSITSDASTAAFRPVRPPLLLQSERSDIPSEPPRQRQNPECLGALAVATHAVGSDEHRGDARSRSPKSQPPSFPQRSATSQPTSTAGAAPGQKIPSQSSRLPINLQINGQTSHLNSQSDRWPSPDAYVVVVVMALLSFADSTSRPSSVIASPLHRRGKTHITQWHGRKQNQMMTPRGGHPSFRSTCSTATRTTSLCRSACPLAATNKYLAQMNKSAGGGRATNEAFGPT